MAARDEVRRALALRPRDPELILLLAELSDDVGEQLRFAAVAAREAPYLVAPAQFAFSVALTVSNLGDGTAEHVKVKAILPDGLEHARGKQVEVDLGDLRWWAR